MGWRIARRIEEILARGLGAEGISFDDAVTLLRLPLHSREAYALMETASRLSRETFCAKGERHLHIGVDAAPCNFNCRFCSLAASAGVFTETVRFGDDELIAWAKAGEAEGADALNLMTTGVYSFGRLLEVGRMLKAVVSTPLVANTRDVSIREAGALRDAGFVGARTTPRG